MALGEEVARQRRSKAWTQKQLADRVGYSGSGAAITIAKIEGGRMRPSDEKLQQLAVVLGVPAAKLVRLADSSGRPNPLAGAQLRRANQRRKEELQERTRQLLAEVEGHYEPLRDAREAIERDLLQPLLQQVAGIQGGDEMFAQTLSQLGDTHTSADGDRALQAELQGYISGVARSMAATFAGGVATGAAAGSALGAGAAFATYSAVTAWATASTGTAIAGLSGAAASSATLAALGGGSLAAGGFGVAGGTAVLASVVAAPAVLAAGVGLFIANKKLRQREESEAARIDDAERQFQRTEHWLQDSFSWTTRARRFLDAAWMVGTQRLAQLDQRAGHLDHPVEWESLKPEAQESLLQLLQLATVTMTVLPLPALPNPEPDDPDGVVERLEARTREWNDAVLEQAMSWFAGPRAALN